MLQAAPTSPRPAIPTWRRRLAKGWRQHGLAYGMIAPACGLMVLVHLIPIAQGIYLSFLKLNQFTLTQFLDAPWVGLDNYRAILLDPQNPVRAGLAVAARNTALYTVVVTTGVLVTGLAVAHLLNRPFRGQALVRTLLLVPWVVPAYVIGILWGFMWQMDGGVINRLLVDGLHLLEQRPHWLTGPNAFWAVVIPTIWRSWPFVMVVFLAGLQTIPQEYYEAAAIDGARPWQRLWHITLPMLRPLIAVQLLFQLIYNVYSFNIVAMMFGNAAGYPGEWADLLMPALNRQSFQLWLFGYGAAASVLLMLAMMMLVWVWYRIFKVELVNP